MRKPTALAAVMLSLALAGPAGASADPYPSCAGTVGASVAGQPGVRAAIAHGFVAEAEPGGHTAGDLQSEWSRMHEPLEGCLEFITP